MGLARRHLASTLLVLLALAVGVGCSDPEAAVKEHRTLGQGYLDGEQWAEAEIEYRNILQIDPNDADAHWGLAQARLGAGDARGAYWELQETVRLDPDNQDAKLRYGQFLVFGKQEDIESALRMADEIIAAEPSTWQAFVLRARALAGLKRSEDIGEALLGATTAAPEEGGPHLLYANFLRGERRNEEAETYYRKVVELEPGFPSHGALAVFLASLDRDDEAEVLLQEAITLAKDDEKVSAYTLYANYLMARDRGDEAEKVLREGIDAQPEESVDLTYTLARFYHAQGRREQADAMILEATQANPKDPKPFLLLSNYRAQIGDMEGALEAAEKSLEADPTYTIGRLRKAEVLVDLGYRDKDKPRIAQGRAIADAVLSQDEGMPEALFVRAKIDLAEGKLDEAIATARRALDSRADWPQAHFLLGSALFLSNQRPQARASVVRALELDPNMSEAQKLLARIHAALGDHELAIETGQKVLRESDDPGLRIMLAQSLVRQGETRKALAELERIPAEDRDAEALYALGRVHTLLGNADAARTHLEQAYEASPTRFEILRALLDSDLRAGNVDASAERVAAAVQAEPSSSTLRQLAGEIALYAGRTVEAEAAFQKAIELNPNDLRAYESLARFLALTGQSDEVLRTYERALEANPTSGPLHLVVGSLYEMQQRTDDAIERYEEAIRLEPELAVAKNNLAYLLAEHGGNLDRALDLAQEAKAMLPDNPNAADTLGWVLLKKDVPSAAIDYLKEAVGGMQPDNAQRSLVRHHLALAYEANDQPDEAREAWTEALGEIAALTRPPAEGQPPRPEPPWALEVKAGLERVGS